MLIELFSLNVTRTASNFFSALPQHRSIRRSVSQPVLLSLFTSLILTRLDYGSATLCGVTGHLLNRLQSVLNAAVRLVCHARKYNHVTHLIRDLHWLRVPKRIYRLAVLVFRCRHNMAPPYLARVLCWTDEAEAIHRLPSGTRQRLIMPRTRLCTIGDSSFRVTAARPWISLPPSVTSAPLLTAFK